MTVLSVPLGLERYQPQDRRRRSRARAVWRIAKWPWISKEEMNGEMLPGSSGETAPIGVQFLVRLEEICVAMSYGVIRKRRARLLASWGCKVVDVALSLNNPAALSQQWAFTAFSSLSARLCHLLVRVG